MAGRDISNNEGSHIRVPSKTKRKRRKTNLIAATIRSGFTVRCLTTSVTTSNHSILVRVRASRARRNKKHDLIQISGSHRPSGVDGTSRVHVCDAVALEGHRRFERRGGAELHAKNASSRILVSKTAHHVKGNDVRWACATTEPSWQIERCDSSSMKRCRAP